MIARNDPPSYGLERCGQVGQVNPFSKSYTTSSADRLPRIQPIVNTDNVRKLRIYWAFFKSAIYSLSLKRYINTKARENDYAFRESWRME